MNTQFKSQILPAQRSALVCAPSGQRHRETRVWWDGDFHIPHELLSSQILIKLDVYDPSYHSIAIVLGTVRRNWRKQNQLQATDITTKTYLTVLPENISRSWRPGKAYYRISLCHLERVGGGVKKIRSPNLSQGYLKDIFTVTYKARQGGSTILFTPPITIGWDSNQ